MKFNRSLILAVAAMAVVAAPAASAADRASEPAENVSELGFGPGLSVLALAAVVAGLIALSDVLEDDDNAVSP